MEKINSFIENYFKLKIDDLNLNTYGDNYEDLITNILLNNKKNGYFIDIGAHDGIYINNSVYFSKIGWKGICVEAHPDYAELCKNNRQDKNTIILDMACSDKNEDNIIFYSNYRGSLSTINPDKNLHDFYEKSGYGPWYKNNEIKSFQNMKNGPISVKSITLNSIIENQLTKLNFDLKNDFIDILSIDVDGSEEYVLKGFDINKYRPKIIIIEYTIKPDLVFKFLIDNNYDILFKIGSNYIAADSKINIINEPTFNMKDKNKNKNKNNIILKAIYYFVTKNSNNCVNKHPLDK